MKVARCTLLKVVTITTEVECFKRFTDGRKEERWRWRRRKECRDIWSCSILCNFEPYMCDHRRQVQASALTSEWWLNGCRMGECDVSRTSSLGEKPRKWSRCWSQRTFLSSITFYLFFQTTFFCNEKKRSKLVHNLCRGKKQRWKFVPTFIRTIFQTRPYNRSLRHAAEFNHTYINMN